MIVHRASHLPKDGWIQRCYECYDCTSNTVFYNLYDKEHTVFLCRSCVKTHNDKVAPTRLPLSLEGKIKNYIEDHTLEPYKCRVIPLDPPEIRKYRADPGKPPLFPVARNNNTPPKIGVPNRSNPSAEDSAPLSPTSTMFTLL